MIGEHVGHCEYCSKDHDLRVACPEYAFRNIEVPTVSKFKLFFIKLFGKRNVGIDGKNICVSYHLKGKIYIVDQFTI